MRPDEINNYKIKKEHLTFNLEFRIHYYII